MPRNVADRLATGLDHLVHRAHRRRVGPVGWEHALDAPAGTWAAGGFPPREGNAVEVLIDGAIALPAIAEGIRSATDHVHLAIWALEPDFALVRADGHVTLRELLAEAAERVEVRVLLWVGAPVLVAHPSSREARRGLHALCAGTRIRGVLDATGRWAGATHQKVMVVDGREAFVGGIDPTTMAGDRYDEPGHPDLGRSGWHDVHTRVRGPLVADVAEHFRSRWRETTGEDVGTPRPPAPAGTTRAQLVRTVPAATSRTLPRGEFTALEAHLAALRGAERLIYLESQYLWSVEVVGVLADKLRRPPHPDFRVVAVLPKQPRAGFDATRGRIRALMAADGGAGRFVACSLRTEAGDAGARRAVYVHAKVVVVDDEWLSVGSLNLSDHSLFNALEVQLVTDDGALARGTRERLWAEHLDLPAAEVEERAAHELVDQVWRPVADEQLERERAGRELTARVVRLPAGSATRRITASVQGLLLGR